MLRSPMCCPLHACPPFRMGNTYLCVACREGYLELADYLISEAMSLGMAHMPPFVPMTVIVKRYASTAVIAPIQPRAKQAQT